MTLSDGTLLQEGKYKIERVLGQGGFGITYAAIQTGLDRRVAIKEFFMKDVCDRDSATSHVTVPSVGSRHLVDRFRQKFLKEARTIAALDHPGITAIHDIFEENGTAYYVMKYAVGGSLKDLVESRGRLPEADAVHYIRAVADAVAYIHRRHINHLDIKPGNIMLDGDGHTMLIDFGLSKQYDAETGEQTSSTPVGKSRGYAAMELYRDGGVAEFSPATDIYALGATLYRMAVGSVPPDAFAVDDAGLPPLPVDLSAGIRRAITESLQSRRRDRPQSVEAFLDLMDNEINNSNSTANIDNEETILDNSGNEPVSLISDVVKCYTSVDLGLSVKWATCNVGASNPHEYGDYYAWGETTIKPCYFEENYIYYDGEKYQNLGNISGNAEFDIARIKLGANWRTPTNKEIQELLNNCEEEWTSVNGVAGCRFTSKRNGNSIFMPATGAKHSSYNDGEGQSGTYWSATSNPNDSSAVFCLYFRNKKTCIGSYSRKNGYPIRPVTD